jgi:hypothetical protein
MNWQHAIAAGIRSAITAKGPKRTYTLGENPRPDGRGGRIHLSWYKRVGAQK